jgi:TRAP-type C4-dicarboxylate transport system permease large subunit
MPIILVLGYDPIWFGVALVILIEMAALTPPVGLNIYTIHGLRPDRPIGEVIAGSMPFFLIQIVGLAIITTFPIIATWLPSTMLQMGN